MTSFLRLTTDMPDTQTPEVPPDNKLTVDVDGKEASKDAPTLSFIKAPATPPHTPSNDGNSPEIPG